MEREQDAWEQEDTEQEALSRKVPCTACGGSALSPYPEDGGSCPHCFGGYTEEDV